MKSNRIMWGLVALIVLTTLAISFGTMSSHSQQEASKKQDNQLQKEDFSKYPIADYNAQKPENLEKLQDRIEKSKRYDNQYIVSSKPHPETDGATIYDETSLPEAIPDKKSNLIVTGQIVSAEAFLSNDKKGVYSEYTITIEEILKGDNTNLTSGSTITMDRLGGYVRYPNGQKVLYRKAGLDLPSVGSRYVLFLKTSGNSPNYEVITGYELKEGSVIPLDSAVDFSSVTEKKEKGFKSLIRKKVSENK
jgi:hypothetical protein